MVRPLVSVATVHRVAGAGRDRHVLAHLDVRLRDFLFDSRRNGQDKCVPFRLAFLRQAGGSDVLRRFRRIEGDGEGEFRAEWRGLFRSGCRQVGLPWQRWHGHNAVSGLGLGFRFD